MAEALLSAAAAADLDAIYLHGYARFGEIQADRYSAGLLDIFAMITERPLIGVACDEVRPGYRRFRYESHVVFYRLIGNDIEVVRILHTAMDVNRHL